MPGVSVNVRSRKRVCPPIDFATLSTEPGGRSACVSFGSNESRDSTTVTISGQGADSMAWQATSGPFSAPTTIKYDVSSDGFTTLDPDIQVIP